MRHTLMLCSLVLTVAACAAPGEYHGVTLPATPSDHAGETTRAKTVSPPPEVLWHQWGR